jgi:hypothetical protein
MHIHTFIMSINQSLLKNKYAKRKHCNPNNDRAKNNPRASCQPPKTPLSDEYMVRNKVDAYAAITLPKLKMERRTGRDFILILLYLDRIHFLGQ